MTAPDTRRELVRTLSLHQTARDAELAADAIDARIRAIVGEYDTAPRAKEPAWSIAPRPASPVPAAPPAQDGEGPEVWVLEDGDPNERIAYVREDFARKDIADVGLVGTLVHYVPATRLAAERAARDTAEREVARRYQQMCDEHAARQDAERERDAARAQVEAMREVVEAAASKPYAGTCWGCEEAAGRVGVQPMACCHGRGSEGACTGDGHRATCDLRAALDGSETP